MLHPRLPPTACPRRNQRRAFTFRSQRPTLAPWMLAVVILAGAAAVAPAAGPVDDALATPPAVVNDVAFQYCLDCHDQSEAQGDFVLEGLLEDPLSAHPEIWEKVIHRTHTRQMPPADQRSRPDDETYEAFTTALTAILDGAAVAHPQPGRTDSFRRMNRTEYRNAVRDLLAVDIDAESLLPADEFAHGFDNITVTHLSPTLLDRLIGAAQKISRVAVGAPRSSPDGFTIRIPADRTQEQHVDGLPLGTRGGTIVPYFFPRSGEYEVRLRLARDRNENIEGLRGEHEVLLLLNGNPLESFTVDRPERGGRQDHALVDQHLVYRGAFPAGPQELGITFPESTQPVQESLRRPFEAAFNYHRHPRRNPALYQVTITGPFASIDDGETPSRQKIFVTTPAAAGSESAAARQILAHLMRQAYRRPVTDDDFVRPMQFYEQTAAEKGYEAGIEMALASILVSPEFVFRIERDPTDLPSGAVYAISDLELASRLAFFIWSSLPDEELLALAEAGQLREPGMLDAQVKRMLADPRAANLATNFAGQWLYLRNLETFTPNLRLFPDFDDNLRRAFREETELFIESIVREDRPAMELLSANYSYLNERLARHYDIPYVRGSRFRRVELAPETNRGGLLRQGSILSVTSYATRTSPVLRGNWVLENILGTPTPPPPPNIPALDGVISEKLPMRERLALHREDKSCAVCHNLMDPVGFSLENFDAVGQWREVDNGAEIDVSGGLPDGSAFHGVGGLEAGLLERPDLFVATLTEKLMTFALGRGLEYYDRPAIRQVVRAAAEDDYRISAIILGIAESVPFQMRTTP